MSEDCEKEVKVRWYVPGLHVPSMIHVLTKYGESMLNGNRETDLITKTRHKHY